MVYMQPICLYYGLKVDSIPGNHRMDIKRCHCNPNFVSLFLSDMFYALLVLLPLCRCNFRFHFSKFPVQTSVNYFQTITVGFSLSGSHCSWPNHRPFWGSGSLPVWARSIRRISSIRCAVRPLIITLFYMCFLSSHFLALLIHHSHSYQMYTKHLNG